MAELEIIMNIRKSLLVISVCAAAVLACSDANAARSPAQQRLYEKAFRVCSGPEYPYGSHPFINYARGWFRCVEPELFSKHGHKGKQ